MRMDLHLHSKYSPDSSLEPKEIVRTARSRGLDGIAITDHNSPIGSLEARKVSDGFLVIRGMEISSAEGHILAYGLSEPIPRGLSPEETVDRIEAAGGVAVAAHPYRFWSGLGPGTTRRIRFPAVESQNARTARSGNRHAQELQSLIQAGGTGGSDAHELETVGEAYTVLEGVSTEGGFLQALQSRQTRGEGKDRQGVRTVAYVTKCVSEWMGRGLKKI